MKVIELLKFVFLLVTLTLIVTYLYK